MKRDLTPLTAPEELQLRSYLGRLLRCGVSRKMIIEDVKKLRKYILKERQRKK